MARKHSSLQTLVDNHCMMMEPIYHIQDTESIKLQFKKPLLDCRPVYKIQSVIFATTIVLALYSHKQEPGKNVIYSETAEYMNHPLNDIVKRLAAKCEICHELNNYGLRRPRMFDNWQNHW